MRTALARTRGASGAVSDLSTGAVRELREEMSEEYDRWGPGVSDSKEGFSLTKGTQC